MDLADRGWLARTMFPVLLVGAVPIIVLYATGLLDDKNVLALSGVIFTACIALTGHIITSQSQRRLAREHDEEEARLRLDAAERARQHDEEEARLRLDAAMRAGALFGTNDQAAGTPAAVASGLLALTQLGHIKLAVALLVDLWDIEPPSNGGGSVAPRGTASHETAILVLDAALRSDDPSAQLIAGELLCRHAACLDITQSLHWPSSIDGSWNPDYGMKTKLLLVDALLLMALRGTPSPSALRSLAVRLYGVLDGDPDPHVKGCLGELMKALVPALQALDVGTFMQGTYELTLEDFILAGKQAKPNPDRMLARIATERSAELITWSMKCPLGDSPASSDATTAEDEEEVPPPPGALAGCDSTRTGSAGETAAGHR